MTDEEKAGVARLLLRRPELRGSLEPAVADDELLADACGEYAAAWRGLEYWHCQNGSLAAERAAEYEALGAD